MRARSILACLAVAPLLVAASKPLRLQPSSPWVLDYAADSCRLTRTFGKDKDKTALQFESTAPQEQSMVAIGKSLRTDRTDVPTKFLPMQVKGFTGQAEIATDKEPVVLWPKVLLLPTSFLEHLKKQDKEEKPKRGVRPPPIDLNERSAERAARQAFATAATELEIDVGYDRPVILETGSLGEAIKMFDRCTRDSLRDWGVDPDLEDKIVRSVWAPDPARWFSPDDYPRKMQMQNKESQVSVRLLVDASGNVTKCTSLSRFDAPEFNQIVCDKFLKQAKFEPAELADGTRVPSYYIDRVVFQLHP